MQGKFEKEVLGIKDIAEMLTVSKDKAADIIRQIRVKHDRLGIRGKIHIMDYIEYFNLPIERYLV